MTSKSSLLGSAVQVVKISRPGFWTTHLWFYLLIFSALFAMQSHLFGQLMDIDQDRIAQRHSTAVTIGMMRAKLLLVAIMCVEVVIAAVFFRGPFVAIFMAAGAFFFLCDTLLGPRRYPIWFTKAFFVGWNVVVIVTMHFVWRYGVFLTD